MKKLPTLSAIASVDEYRRLAGQTVRRGNRKVVVSVHRTESRLGSYERGLQWRRSEYGLLIWHHASERGCGYYRVTDYSVDHGATWHPDVKTAMRLSRRGRVKLEAHREKEFAFDAIQATNRKYEGPGYRWRP